jgi:antitoxin CptB
MPDNPYLDRESARVRWLCRRGMKELDVLLSHYFEMRYDQASAAEQRAFSQLLERQDPELYDLILGASATNDTDEARVLDQLRQYGHR